MLRLRLRVRRQALREVGKAFAVGFMAAAVLWLTSGYPVVSQQVPQPPSRDQIVQGLEQVLAVTLTASEGDILDVEHAIFYSDPELPSVALIPLHPSSRSLGLMPLEVLYLEADWPSLPPLPALFPNSSPTSFRSSSDRVIS